MASTTHAPAGGVDESQIPFSLLDTDLYKVCWADRICVVLTDASRSQLTMQNAVLHCYPDAMAEYKFTNRAMNMVFSRTCFEWIQTRLNGGRRWSVDFWLVL